MLNLDDVPASSTEVVVKLKGKEHEMVPLSVKKFIEHIRRVEALEKGTILDEVGVMVDSIRDAVPTMPQEDLEELSLEQMQQIVTHIQKASEAKDEDEDESEKDSEGNEQKAE